MDKEFINFVVIALAVSSVSFTVTFTSLFKGFRDHVSTFHYKVEELVHCPWCFSHWVSFALVPLSGSVYSFTEYFFLNFLLSVFAVTALSGLLHHVLLRAYEPVAKASLQRKLEKMKNSSND